MNPNRMNNTAPASVTEREEAHQIQRTRRVGGTSIPYFTSIFVEMYRPAITAPAVQQAWPTTVPIVTRYTLCEQSFSLARVKAKRIHVHGQHPGQLWIFGCGLPTLPGT